MTDPLADFWVHTVTVERLTSAGGGYGDQFAPPVPVTGFYQDGTKIVPGPNGEQIAVAGVFAFPADVDYVPLLSRVTLPAQFGGRITRVKSVAVGDGGDLPTPDHQQIGLL